MCDETEDASKEAPTRAFVVLHPRAGRCDAPSIRRKLESGFSKNGWDYDIYETTGLESLPDVIHGALGRGFNLFVVAGGDGTVSDVAEGLVHTEALLGIVPVGTGNIVARELWIPIAPYRACNLITGRHRITRIDAMRVGDRHYFLNLSAGFASLMIRDTKLAHKRIFGIAAYLWAGFTALLGFQPQKFEIDVDGVSRRYWALEVSVANSGILAMRPFSLGKGIFIDDGRLDVCIIRARTILDYLGLAVRIVMRLQEYDGNIEYLRAERSVGVKADEALVVQADGEVIGHTPIQVHVVPKAVKVIVPERRRRLSLWNSF
jgi:YegS/Rv2252/BmrU family lipid kinase